MRDERQRNFEKVKITSERIKTEVFICFILFGFGEYAFYNLRTDVFN